MDDIYSDSSRVPRNRQQSNNNLSYNDFKPNDSKSQRNRNSDIYDTVELPPQWQDSHAYNPYQQQVRQQAQQQRRQPQRQQQRRSQQAGSQRSAGASRPARQGRQQAEVRLRGDIPMDKDTLVEMQNAQAKRQAASPKKKKKKGKWWQKLLCIILVLVLLYLGVSYLLFHNTDYSTEEHAKNQYISSLQLKSSPFVENILLLGSDAREGDTVSRSDTMILVSIDKKHSKIKLTSFLRDSYVEIPGHGYNKLNAACTYGGTQLVIDTIEYNYKIKIDKYAMVDFNCFQELIDAIGGVDVKVTQAEANYLNRTWYRWSLTGNKLHFDSGESVHLNGEEALMFCRIRGLDSDIKRTERQRRVISAIKTQAMSSLTPSTINSVLKNVLPYITTDIRENQLMNKGIGYLLLYRNYDIAEMSIPYTGTWHDETISGVGASLVFDIDENATIVQNFIYNDEYENKDA